MIARGVVRGLRHVLPEQVRRRLRWTYFLRRHKALLAELSSVPIVQSGCEMVGGYQAPYVVLKDGTVLYGQRPTPFEREVYARWRDSIAPTIAEDAIRVAMDVILRYLYPHAMPQLTMPYPRKARECFHRQHMDTIEDLPGLSRSLKDELREIYSPTAGESFLDVGAYMGYGSIRLSKELGAGARIICSEPDPDSLRLLEHNVLCNNLSNVTIITKAVWNREGMELDLYKAGRQASSLTVDAVDPCNVVSVQTTTVDAMLKDIDEGCVDIISVTVNGAEVEAVEGMKDTLQRCEHVRLSIAGWYRRGDQRVCDVISPILRESGLEVAVGRSGGVLAWR